MIDKNIDLEKISLYSKHIFKWKCSFCGIIFDKSVVKMHASNYVKCEMCSQSKAAAKIQKTLNYFNIKYKKEYKFKDLISNYSNRKLRFDFVLFKDKKLVNILEYDGQYHDFQETTMQHDKIKNDYCLKNKIPLFRIHHTHDLMNCLLDFLIQYDFITDKQKEEYLIIIKLSKIKNKISKLKEEEMQLELKLKEIKVNECF